MAAKRKTQARAKPSSRSRRSPSRAASCRRSGSRRWPSSQAGTQVEADYRIPKGLNLRDEIGRYWRIAQAHWGDFDAGRATAKADPKAVSPSASSLALLRDAFGFASLASVEPAVHRGARVPHRTRCARRARARGHRSRRERARHARVRVRRRQPQAQRLRPRAGVPERAGGRAVGHRVATASRCASCATTRASRAPRGSRPTSQRIFTEERYADFAALWLLAHETRFGRAGSAGHRVRARSVAQRRPRRGHAGARAPAARRRGRARCAWPGLPLAPGEPGAPRGRCRTARCTMKDYFNQLLRLVYRLIFLLTVEERELLHPDGTTRRGEGAVRQRLRPAAPARALGEAQRARSASRTCGRRRRSCSAASPRESRASGCPRSRASSRRASARRSMRRSSRTARCSSRCSSSRGCARTGASRA